MIRTDFTIVIKKNFFYAHVNNFIAVCEILKEYYDKHLRSTRKKNLIRTKMVLNCALWCEQK